MPKLTCLCGTTINLSPIPNPVGFYIFPEATSEAYEDALTSPRRDGETAHEHRVRVSQGQLRWRPFHSYECPICGRLAVLYGDDVVRWFAPDPADANPSLVDTAAEIERQRGGPPADGT